MSYCRLTLQLIKMFPVLYSNSEFWLVSRGATIECFFFYLGRNNLAFALPSNKGLLEGLFHSLVIFKQPTQKRSHSNENCPYSRCSYRQVERPHDDRLLSRFYLIAECLSGIIIRFYDGRKLIFGNLAEKLESQNGNLTLL